MNFFFACGLIILCLPNTLCFSFWTHDPDVYKNVSEMITERGYPVENHIIQTDDGYLLSVQRIRYGRNGQQNSENRQAVLLHHGIFSTADDYVMNFPEQSLAFILADQNYDVWLANARGSYYCKQHVKLSTSSNKFWDFSFQEMAQYDLPAMIDYILKTTQQEQLMYVGFSQGTTIAFALLSESPHYNDKIKLFIALAPITTVGQITKNFKYLAPLGDHFYWLLKLLRINQIFTTGPIRRQLIYSICETAGRPICNEISHILVGFDEKQMNVTRFPVFNSHFPSGGSSKSLIHYAQLVISKKFRKFDYKSQNKKHYNQNSPPEYDVSRITTPTALYWSTADDLSNPRDVSLLRSRLTSIVEDYKVPSDDFKHAHFVYGIHAHSLVYKNVISLMKKYSSK